MSGLDAELPPLPAFDPRALRRAVRRGVIRTAIVGGIWVLVALFLLSILGAGITSALGRPRQLTHVVAVGWQVSHPEFVAENSGQQTNATSTQVRLTVQALGAGATASSVTLSFREGILGGISADSPEPKSAASQVLLDDFGNPEAANAGVRADERKMLLGLPAAVRVAAILQFATPMSFDAYRRFAGAHEKNSEFAVAPVLFSAALQPIQFRGPHLIRGVYGWNLPYDHGESSGEFHTVSDLLGGFRGWVNTLHDSDGSALAAAGIDLRGLRTAARDGRVYGAILKDVAPPFLVGMLNDPAIGAIHPYDVEFAVDGANG
jgi:hypothetical protein